MNKIFSNPFGEDIELERYPKRDNELLQAWDSADELLLDHLKELGLESKKILILNDSFGALSISLKEYGPVSYTDSYLSYKSIVENSNNEVIPLFDLDQIEGSFDLVIVKLPKNLSFFEDQLARVSGHVNQESKFIFSCMVKHMAKGHFDLIQKIIGETSTSLAKKKARLIFANVEKESIKSKFPLEVSIENFEEKFVHHSNIFSRSKLDIGTRFFLDNIPTGFLGKILDLGCANGIIGIKAKMLNPDSKIYFSDESYMAIKSARENYKRFFSDEAEFIWTNCYDKDERESFDLILCNPPFHQNTTVGDHIARQMFRDAKKHLKTKGLLRVIGNSHLKYHKILEKIFGGSKIVSKNKKFLICDSLKF